MFAPFVVFMVLDLTVWYYFSLGESFSTSEPEGILKMFLKFQQSYVKFYDKLGFYKIKVYCTMPVKCNFGKLHISNVLLIL